MEEALAYCLLTAVVRSRLRQRGLKANGFATASKAPPGVTRPPGPRLTDRFLKGPLVTHPPPVPDGKVSGLKPGMATVMSGWFATRAPLPDMEVSLPSKTGCFSAPKSGLAIYSTAFEV